MMATTKTHSWAVTFAGTVTPFATRAEAKRFVKTHKKDVADQRGGTFNAVIVRISATGKGAIN